MQTWRGGILAERGHALPERQYLEAGRGSNEGTHTITPAAAARALGLDTCPATRAASALSRPYAVQAHDARSWGTGEDADISCDEWLDSAMVLLLRMSEQRLTEDDQERLARAASAFMANEGAISFDRCLGLRGLHATWRIARRDLAIARAIRAMGIAGKWLPFARLADEWDHFIAAGPWRAWRDHAGPPESATELQGHLYWASRYNRGQALSGKRIQGIYRQLSGSQCQ